MKEFNPKSALWGGLAMFCLVMELHMPSGRYAWSCAAIWFALHWAFESWLIHRDHAPAQTEIDEEVIKRLTQAAEDHPELWVGQTYSHGMVFYTAHSFIGFLEVGEFGDHIQIAMDNLSYWRGTLDVIPNRGTSLKIKLSRAQYLRLMEALKQVKLPPWKRTEQVSVTTARGVLGKLGDTGVRVEK